LLLRQWKDKDFPVFVKLNSDPQVMQYFSALLSKDESDALAQKYKALISERGWGVWATELKDSGELIGCVGIHIPKETLPFSPCVEIGWRLLKKCWGNGYATEAATQALRFSFENLDFNEVVSFTTISNNRSRSVMKGLGLINTNQNFEHPDLPQGHLLSENVLYKITKSQWLENGL